jgi:membrane peptidoglycan carboxypeptidase
VKYHGSRVNHLVARDILSAPPSQMEGMRTLWRHVTTAGVTLLLPLHLNEDEILAAFTSQAYMGPGVRGFSQAAQTYMGAPLENLDRNQAAKLIAIADAPSIYLRRPEYLERKVQLILARASQE